MSKALATKNVAAVALALAMIVGFAFAFATPAKADVLSDLQAQVQALLAQISSLQGGSGTTVGASCTTFTQNLKAGSTGGEVMALQKFLNSNGFQIAASGAGSPGNETSYFGGLTKAAVVRFQNAYASDILAPVGLTAGTGNWFASTRAKANALCVGGVVTTPPGTTPPGTTPGPVVAGNLNVGMASQPANSLAPQGTARVPFTTFTLTNSSGAAVTVNSVAVQRTGLGNDAAFAGIVLIDEMGTQLGNARTFNSNHTVNAGDAFVINPGQTKTITVAGNMASSLTSYTGQVVSLTVTGINTSATVSGSLPITGASQTLNNTLTVGTATLALGSSDLNAAQTSESIGKTAEIGASIRVTAGSAEDVWVKAIRWNQSGSASSGDIANVVTVVDGTSYPTTVSSDGKYYTTIFPGNGLSILKGLNKEIIAKFDVVSGSARTVQFDVYKGTDIYVLGGTYGYGISPTQSSNCNATASTATTGSEFINTATDCTGTAGTPFFSGSTFTIAAGTFTSLSRASEVPAQNIALVSPNQALGGFAMDVKGEPIQIQSQVFYFGYSSDTASSNLLTSVRMVDSNGTVVAGPVDAANVAGVVQKVTFTDTVTYPVGRHVYTLQGQLPSTVTNGQTLIASTTPSTGWTSVTGQGTGDAISLSTLSSTVSGNTMTVRSGAVVASVNATPAAQTIVAGVSGLLLGQFNLDATQSGEDVRFTSMKVYYTDSMTNDPTNCFLYDGATRLNDTAVNPATSGDDTYTLNTTLTVVKGTVKVVGIKCDLSGSATSGDFSFGINDSSGATFSGTGVSSSQTITPTTSTGALAAGNTMSMTSGGTLTVTLDASSPSYAVAAGGTSNVTLGVLRFSGINEAMRLDRVSLEMTGVEATSSPGNISQVTLWDGATQVGTAIFAGTRHATSTISTTVNSGAGVVIPANGYKNLTVKGDLAAIGTSQAGKQGALIQVDFDGADTTGTRAIGQSSGTTINQNAGVASSDTAAAGVRTFRSYPTLAKLAVPTTVLTTGSNVDLYRFSITANASGDVGLYQVTVNIATSTYSTANGTTSVTGLKLYGFTDATFSSGISGFTSGLLSDGAVATQVLNGDNTMTIDQSSLDKVSIPAGTTYYFKVIGTVAQNAGTTASVGSVTTYLAGDAAYPVVNDAGNLMQQADNATTGSTADVNNDFIWSPNATTTSATANHDWTNGYGVAGLPASGTDTVTLSK